MAAGEMSIGVESTRQASPVWVKNDRGDGEDDHQQSREAEGALDPLEFGDEDKEREQQTHSEQDELFRPSGEEMRNNGQAAEFGCTCEQVKQVGSHQGRDAERLAEAIANDRKDRLSGDNGYPAAHLHVDDDGECAEDDRP